MIERERRTCQTCGARPILNKSGTLRVHKPGPDLWWPTDPRASSPVDRNGNCKNIWVATSSLGSAYAAGCAF